MAELFALIFQLYEDEFLLKAKLTRIEEVRKLVKKKATIVKERDLDPFIVFALEKERGRCSSRNRDWIHRVGSIHSNLWLSWF